MRWIPLQNARSKRWQLCVIHDDCASYDVTELDSGRVDDIISYAAYMNGGGAQGIDRETVEALEKLKRLYGMEDAAGGQSAR